MPQSWKRKEEKKTPVFTYRREQSWKTLHADWQYVLVPLQLKNYNNYGVCNHVKSILVGKFFCHGACEDYGIIQLLLHLTTQDQGKGQC